MKRIFVSSVQKEFERERAAIKKMIESDPILKPNFKAFVFEIDAPASAASRLRSIRIASRSSAPDASIVRSASRMCKANGLKTPLLEEVPSGFRIVIWRPERADNRGGNAQKSRRKSMQKGSLKSSLKGSLKSSLKILEILAKEPTCTYDELAEQLSVSRRAITKQIKNLREAGKLRRIGPDKGGHWEVVGMANE